MYYRVFMNDGGGYYCILGQYPTLEEAAKSRQVSGDLIIGEDNQIVKDDSWLWQYEKDDPKSYAARCIKDGVRLTWPAGSSVMGSDQIVSGYDPVNEIHKRNISQDRAQYFSRWRIEDYDARLDRSGDSVCPQVYRLKQFHQQQKDRELQQWAQSHPEKL